uniref:Uncharacterized protein n=1 Tax=Archaeoglobus fulgidus TaxID=2234 RepID=A0A7J2TI39_ARCFL
MKIIQNVIEEAKEGDKILITFPDLYSFYSVFSWLNQVFGDFFWILWTDAAVERVNHLGKKYNFPRNGEAIVIASEKDCFFLRVIERLELEEIRRLNSLLPENRLILSFGINFLNFYGRDLSRVIDSLIEIENGILITAIVGKAPEELKTFHDFQIDVMRSEDSFIAYHNYVAKLTFSMKGGVTILSDSLDLR